jgi:hypothetical protein
VNIDKLWKHLQRNENRDHSIKVLARHFPQFEFSGVPLDTLIRARDSNEVLDPVIEKVVQERMGPKINDLYKELVQGDITIEQLIYHFRCVAPLHKIEI